jgi:hypothetical protein
LQILKSALARQPPIGHGFFGELTLFNFEPPAVNGRLLFPYGRLEDGSYQSRLQLYEFLARNSDREALLSFREEEPFADARGHAKLGLYYSWKDGGSTYYSSEAFAAEWLHRREVNNRFFSPASTPEEVWASAAEMRNAGVRWVLASQPVGNRAGYLSLAFRQGDVRGYAFAVPPEP